MYQLDSTLVASGALCSLILLGGVVLFAPAEVEACDWGWGQLDAAIPQAGSEIPPETEFSLWRTKGTHADLSFELVDGDGESIPVDSQQIRTGRATIGEVDHRIVTPRQLLEPGEHTLTAAVVDEGDSEAWMRDVDGEWVQEISLQFEVVDDAVDPPPDPEQYEWTRTTYPFDTECYAPRQQWHQISVDEQSARDDVWYEISYVGDGSIEIASQPGADSLRHHIEQPGDCVIVEAVAIDGTRSEPVERCEPDRCFEEPTENQFVLIPCGDDDDSSEAHDDTACSSLRGSSTPPMWAVATLLAMAAVRRGWNR